MDSFEAHDITFLDLTGVDEQERKEVLTSLYAENAKVQLPWKVLDHSVLQSSDGNSHSSSSNNNESSDSEHSASIAETNQKIVPQNQQQQQLYLTGQLNYNNYTPPPPHNPYRPSPSHAIYPYPLPPQYIVCSPATYPQTYIQAVVTTHITGVSLPYAQAPYTSDSYVEEVIDDTQTYENVAVGGAEEIDEATSEVNREEEKVVDENCNVASSNGVCHEEQNGVLQKEESIKEVCDEPVGAGRRSWASLFNSSTSAAARSANFNSVNDKGGNSEAVSKENGNADECPIRNPKKAEFIDPNCYRMGEFLLNHSVDGRTISLKPRGLINKSNYCYINSILQALVACPPIYNLLVGLLEQNTSAEKAKPTPIIDGMCRFIKEFQHLPAGLRVNRRNDKNQKKDQGVSIDYDLPFEPSWIYKMLNGIRSDSFLVEGRQEDAEEFLGCLLNGLNDEMLELMKLVKSDLAVNKFNSQQENYRDTDDKEWQVMGPKNKGGITRQIEFTKTPISNIFGGDLKSRIHRTGDQSTYNIQPFFTLQLNIEKVKTVREALEALVSKNQLEGVTSEKTNEEVEAWQQVTLEELPVILILHLKCFDFKLDGCTKIIKALEFPIDLKIDSKLLSSKPTTAREKQYKLFAVVYHDGKEATKGHYVTDAFHVGYSSWIRYDDSSVKAVQEEQVLKPQGTRVPYLLFYRRSDTIRSK